jgi:hypothetical protein
MLTERIEHLEGKSIAIVAMGISQIDYHLSVVHSDKFDEVWVINAMIGVVKNADRAFILDPMTRFFDSNEAADMTEMMREELPKIEYPIYSCELDSRVPAVEEFPIEALIKDTGCGYLNNTVAYAIAFAYWNKVGSVSMFGTDFTYNHNAHFAEMGRACCEFWLGKCMESNILVQVAVRCNLLDCNVDVKEKLYGYHRLNDPIVSYVKDDELKVCRHSEVIQETVIPHGIIGRENPKEWVIDERLNGNGPPEPNVP